MSCAICLSSISFGQITASFDALADGSYGDTEQTHAFDSGQWASLACIINSDKERGGSGRAVRFRHDMAGTGVSFQSKVKQYPFGTLE